MMPETTTPSQSNDRKFLIIAAIIAAAAALFLYSRSLSGHHTGEKTQAALFAGMQQSIFESDFPRLFGPGFEDFLRHYKPGKLSGGNLELLNGGLYFHGQWSFIAESDPDILKDKDAASRTAVSVLKIMARQEILGNTRQTIIGTGSCAILGDNGWFAIIPTTNQGEKGFALHYEGCVYGNSPASRGK